MATRPLVSVKTILLKVVRDLNLGGLEIPWQDLVEWCAEGLQHIGAYSQYTEKYTGRDGTPPLFIENFSCKLPEDFYSAASNTFSYKINGDTLTVAQQSGELHGFHYLAMPLDEEGYPLIPDHVSYATALFWKCAMQLSMRGQLPNKELSYMICKDRWGYYCRQAAASHGFNEQLARSFSGFFNARIPILTQQDSGFLKDLAQEPTRLGTPILTTRIQQPPFHN